MNHVIVETKYGKVACYKKDDCISATIKGGTFWDGPLLLPFYEKYAKKGEVAIDIGSFNGLSALYLSSRCKEVIAVEPIHHLLMVETVAANGLRNVTTIPGAAYNELCWMLPAADKDQGQKVLGVEPWEIDNPGGVALVRVPTVVAQEVECIQTIILDKWVEEDEKVCLIKSDAQGCDLRALKGLETTIIRDRPAILFEFEEKLAELQGDGWEDYLTFFTEAGYVLKEQNEVGYARNFVAVAK